MKTIILILLFGILYGIIANYIPEGFLQNGLLYTSGVIYGIILANNNDER